MRILAMLPKLPGVCLLPGVPTSALHRAGPRDPAVAGGTLSLRGRVIPLILMRHPRGRRLVLRLRPDGSARVTVPRGASWEEARRFAERHAEWLERQLLRMEARPKHNPLWPLGATLLFRGEEHRLEASEPAAVGEAGGRLGALGAPGDGEIRRERFVCLGAERIPVADPGADLRSEVEWHLRCVATRELPPRLLALAAAEGLAVQRITVRDQRSRWGSCSRRGTVSLNWRLVQAPPAVSDYILLHELMHLRHMNHSVRFWREVERVCPAYREAEGWLRRHGWLLR